MNDEQAEELISIIAHIPLTKVQAAQHLNIPVHKFNRLLGMKALPPGRSKKGSNELVWYKDELDKAIVKWKKPLSD